MHVIPVLIPKLFYPFPIRVLELQVDQSNG
jgi:hypothetical protein